MRYLVTGGTGFIGSALVTQLLDADHDVVALVRSASSAQRLEAAGATAHRGSLDDPASLVAAARRADGVIHTAFPNSDLRRFRRNAAVERRALQALGAELAGSGRPLVAAGGLAPVRAAGSVITEGDPVSPHRGLTGRNVKLTLARLAQQGVATSAVRLPCVHGDGDRFTLHGIIALSRRNGAVDVVGEGSNVLPAVHRDDAAAVLHLAAERAEPAARYDAVAEKGVPYWEVAQVIAHRLGVPVRSTGRLGALRRLGAFAGYVASNRPASSAVTRTLLGWEPTGPGLLEDLDRPEYFA